MKRIPKVYIAGPMSGIKDHNKPAFDNAEDRLREDYIFKEIMNPINTELSHRVQAGELMGEEAYRLCMALDLKFICEEATALYMLKGWENSKGAKAEHATAVCLGLDIIYE